MYVMEKFLYFFELEVGAFVIGMLGFTTSFIIDIFFVFLLYQTECVGLFKLYTGATVVTYYTITSFLLVREIFCERRASLVKHFLVIDVFVTMTMISFYVRCFEFYPSWLPFYILDTLIRFYSAASIYSLYIKFRNATRLKKLELSLIKSVEGSQELKFPQNEVALSPGGDGAMRIFDTFFCFMRLEVGAFLYAGLNIICSIVIMLYLIVYVPMMEGKEGDGNELNILDIVFFVIAFVVNFGMTMSLIVGIKMRKSSILIPFLVFTILAITFSFYLLFQAMVVIIQFETYKTRMARFIDKIKIFEPIVIGIWIYFYLCICSLFDLIMCEENEKKMLVAKECITFGSADDARRSSSL